MKNLLNFLDDYFDNNIDEQLCNCKKKMKGKMDISEENSIKKKIKTKRKQKIYND